MRSVSLFILSVAALAAPAAASDPVLGAAVQANVVAMTVDLTPAYANVKIEGGAGTLADGAVSRYRSGQVKALIPLSGKSAVGAVTSGGAAAGGAPAGGPAGGQGGEQN